jgi:hypothetical protein
MLKDKKFTHGRDMVELIRDGEFLIMVRATRRIDPQDGMLNMDSIS